MFNEMFKEMYVLELLPLSFLFGSIAAIIRALLDRREINKQLKEYPSEQEIRDRILLTIQEENEERQV